MTYSRWLLSLLWKPLALIGGLLFLRWAGARDAKLKADMQDGKKYAKQRRAIDEALETLGDDPATLRNAMRLRGERPE